MNDVNDLNENYFLNWRRLVIVVVAAVAYGVVARLLFNNGSWTTVSTAFLCGVPVVIGALAVFFSPEAVRLSYGKAMTVATVTSVISMTGFIVFNMEAALCIFMASPLYTFMSMLGGLVTTLVLRQFRRRNADPGSLNVVIAALVFTPFVFAPFEAAINPPVMIRTVHSQIVINATPDVIWQHIIRVDEIMPEEQSPSLFQVLGIPRPVESTLEQEALGAVRRGYFEHGLSFYETITEWQPNEAIEFEIEVANQELLPMPLSQVGGEYLDMLDARYDIEAREDGTVILHLRSSYQLTTTFNPYAALWVDFIVRDFQGYLLGVLKNRIEAVNS